MNSFEGIKEWFKEVRKYYYLIMSLVIINQHTDSDATKMILGNKCDLDVERAVSMEEGQEVII